MNHALLGVISGAGSVIGQPTNPPDPLYGSVSMLLNLNGEDNSTSIIDSSIVARTFTANNDAALTTAEYVFGGASLQLDGFSSVTAPSTLLMNSTNFCIEGWVMLNDVSQGFQAIIAHNTPIFSTASTYLGVFGDSHPVVANRRKLAIGNFQSGVAVKSVTSISSGVWYYFAITRQDNTVRIFINGVLESEVVGAFGNFDFGNNGTIIGSVGWNSTERLSGMLDDLRYTQQTRYTESFPVPSYQFPDY